MQETTISTPIRISGLYYYPVKSCRGISIECAIIDAQGIRNDRRLMLIDRSGRFLTQRGHPGVALIEAFIEGAWLTLNAPNMRLLTIKCTNTGEKMAVSLWEDRCEAVDQGDEVAQWLSTYIGTPCRLVSMHDGYVRQVHATYAHAESDQVGFADGFPFLLISEASLEDLNARLVVPVTMQRFRPNIVVSGTLPFAEDTWKVIRIRDVEFHIVKPCARCVVTTIDQQNGIQAKEPLRTLATYRHVRGKGVMFGQNLVHNNEGVINVGDVVHIIR